jgi:CDP-diacylglycerol--glycerol-3-phosphate 3-phosphatidyltransferase
VATGGSGREAGGRARGFRRLSGLDRSGPRPRQTRRGEPLRPFTIPNLVGYLRLAGIPIFLVLALGSGDGRSAPAAIIYLGVVAGDFLDGFLARATGQYSRLGSLLDPLVDRLSVVAGIVVAWRFELLPRWALALAVVREIVTLVLSELALRRGVEIEINWVGRISVFCVFTGLFWSMVIDSWVTAAVFIVGVALGIAATVIYARAGRAVHARRQTLNL